MKKVLVALAPGFEEIETITVVDILRRAGARVVLAATVEGPIEGSRGVTVLPDDLIDQVDENEFMRPGICVCSITPYWIFSFH